MEYVLQDDLRQGVKNLTSQYERHNLESKNIYLMHPL